MARRPDRLQTIVMTALAAVAGLSIWWFFGAAQTAVQVEVTVPQLSDDALKGKAVFEENCLVCHGQNAAGSKNGPPLVHKIYEPGHHADFSFVMAVKKGVRAHHWRFGNMEPMPGITDDQISLIIRYVRELQRANGIN